MGRTSVVMGRLLVGRVPSGHREGSLCVYFVPREDFKEMTEAEKVAKIMRAVEGLEKEVSSQLSR